MIWIFMVPLAIFSIYKQCKKIRQESQPKNNKLYLICWIIILISSVSAVTFSFLTKELDIYKLLELLFSSFITMSMIPLPCGIAFFNQTHIRPYRNMALALASGIYLYFTLAIYFAITKNI